MNEKVFAEEETIEVVEKKDNVLKRAWNWGKDHVLEVGVGLGAATLALLGLKSYSNHQDEIAKKEVNDGLDLAFNMGVLEGKVSAYKEMLDGNKDEINN